MKIRQGLHDLSQPLAAITGFIDLWLLEIDAADPRLKEVQTASEQMEEVLRLMAEIRHLAREASLPEAAGRGAAAQPGL